jgi:LysM repeat protein
MMKTKRWLLGWIVVAVLVLVIGGAAAFVVLVPEVTEQLPPGLSSVVVTLSSPSNDAQVPLYQFTTVSAEAVGAKPIIALELWIDGTPSGTQNAPDGSTLNRFNTYWTWTPASEGEHALLVRAIDVDHNIGMSNIVRVTASKESDVAASVVIQTKPGDTVSSVAQEIKVDPQQIIDLNLGIDATSTITPGESIAVPIPLPPSPSPTPQPPPSVTPEPPGDPNQPPSTGGPNKYQVWWNHNIFKLVSAIKPPAAPGLSASVGAGKCSIDLYIYDKSDNEDGFFLYQLAPNAAAFTRIATLDAHSGSQPIHYVDPAITGPYQYYISSFNAMGESPSTIVMTKILDSCIAPQQQTLGLNNAIVTVGQPVDKIYCYLQVDNGLWTRVPPGANTFITPTKPGQFDLSQYLKSLTPSPPPPQITLHLECWGWNGGALVPLGEATKTIKEGQVQIKAPNWQLIANLSAQMHLLQAPGDPEIAPPINAKLTTDQNECLSHYRPVNSFSHAFETFLCSTAVADGQLILTWDWLPAGCTSGNCSQDIDGFYVYMIYPGQANPSLIHTVPSQRVTTDIFPPPPSNGLPPQVFVRAFKGTSVSADSNYVTVQTAPTTVEIPLGNSRWVTGRDQSDDCEGYYPGHYALFPPTGPIVAGYEFQHTDCDFRNVIYQGLAWFDMNKIPKGLILSALLRYKWVDGMFSPGPEYATTQKVSCASELMVAKNDWRTGAQTIYADPYLQLPWGGSPEAQYSWDVTSAVKEWVQGSRPNYGFVLIGPNQWIHQEWGTVNCTSVYDDFVLDVSVQQ